MKSNKKLIGLESNNNCDSSDFQLGFLNEYKKIDFVSTLINSGYYKGDSCKSQIFVKVNSNHFDLVFG